MSELSFFRSIRLQMTGSDFNSVCGSSDQTTMRGSIEGESGSAAVDALASRCLSGSSHSCRIKRATAAQKLLWLALAPPIQLELGACPDALSRSVVPVFCGLGSGAEYLIIQSYVRPETERPIQSRWAGQSSYENVRASRERGPSDACSRCAG